MTKARHGDEHEGREPAPAHKGGGRWRVELEHCVTLEVEAADEAAAWAEYKKQAGLYAEPWHRPVITQVG